MPLTVSVAAAVAAICWAAAVTTPIYILSTCFSCFLRIFFLIASYTSCALCRKSTIRCEIHWTSHCMCNTHCVCLYLFRWLPVHNDEAICLQSTYVCVRFFFGVYLFNCFLWKYVKFIEEKKNRNKFEYTTGKSKQSTATIPTHTHSNTNTEELFTFRCMLTC